jgi:heme exporter protein A
MQSPHETAPTGVASALANAASGPALTADALVRAFGGRRAVNGVSLTLHEGACLALFGPNGAGKSTLLRLLGGLLKPTTGTTRLHGQPLPGEAETRRLVGLISHHAMLYPALSVRENVRFAAECQGVIDADDATTRVLTQLRVLDRADTAVRYLSRGLQQRVSIARALVHGPQLVLLDEPYTGLDETGAQALTEALGALKANGATLVLVTHNLSEGLALATHSAIMQHGKFVDEQPVSPSGFDVAAYQAKYRALVHEGLA